ncbi:MAG: hypothetical protein QOE89_1012 [Pseudonocardiales bacterium]|nr:hypothetical protein [Pseudonocardiales bacterium]
MTSPVSAVRPAGPLWARGRFGLVLAGLLVVGAFAVALVRPAPGLPLDPASTSKAGSAALAQLLRQRGTSVDRVAALAQVPAGRTVVVAEPAAYSSGQLTGLINRGSRLVLIAPTQDLVSAIDPRLWEQSVDTAAQTVSPDCSHPGALAAGDVRFPAGTRSYGGLPGCYHGRAVLGDEIVVLGSAGLIRNDGLTQPGVAALAINALSTDSSGNTVGPITWLMPGADAAGPGQPSVWSVFPPWAHRALLWLILLGGLVVLWRGRRMGPAVSEPLPVVVRAAEIIEGHGRLYLRAQARDRAAAALRTATADRLTARFGPRPEITSLRSGPVPADDRALVRLAGELAELEAAAADFPSGKASYL